MEHSVFKPNHHPVLFKDLIQQTRNIILLVVTLTLLLGMISVFGFIYYEDNMKPQTGLFIYQILIGCFYGYTGIMTIKYCILTKNELTYNIDQYILSGLAPRHYYFGKLSILMYQSLYGIALLLPFSVICVFLKGVGIYALFANFISMLLFLGLQYCLTLLLIKHTGIGGRISTLFLAGIFIGHGNLSLFVLPKHAPHPILLVIMIGLGALLYKGLQDSAIQSIESIFEYKQVIRVAKYRIAARRNTSRRES